MIQFLEQVPQTGGIDYVRVFIRYVVATQEDTTVAEFDEMLKAQTDDTGGEIVTYAQQLLREGELKGKLEGKLEERVELINGFLRADVSWATITEATGVDQVQFVELKQQLAQLQEDMLA